jgi:tetratricopeptide (TPR) repeat protein
LAAAEQGLACDPDDTGCNNLRAIALVNLGRKAEAGQTIDAALAKNPEDAVTHANQGWTLLHQRQPVEAMTHFREALRLEPNLEWARHGIVEAMKARFFLYRWLLSFFLWMSRFPPNVRFGLLLGLVFGRTILANVLQSFPVLEFLVEPISIAYVIFVWMTWTASSLFNLVLRLDKFGRLALSPEERRESNLVGGCLILSLAVALTSIGFDHRVSGRMWMTSLLYLGLMLPLISIFRQPARQKTWLTIYGCGVAFCIAMTTFLSLKVCSQFSSLAPSPDFNAERLAGLRSLSDSGWQWFSYSIWGIVLSTWISAGLSLAPNRSSHE